MCYEIGFPCDLKKSAIIFDMGYSLSSSSQSTHFPKIVQLLKPNGNHLQQQTFLTGSICRSFDFVGL